MHSSLLPSRADIPCSTWGEGSAHEWWAEKSLCSPLPSAIETYPDKSLGLPATQNLLPSDLMAKRSSSHMLDHLVTKALNQQNKHCAYREKTNFIML